MSTNNVILTWKTNTCNLCHRAGSTKKREFNLMVHCACRVRNSFFFAPSSVDCSKSRGERAREGIASRRRVGILQSHEGKKSHSTAMAGTYRTFCNTCLDFIFVGFFFQKRAKAFFCPLVGKQVIRLA